MQRSITVWKKYVRFTKNNTVTEFSLCPLPVGDWKIRTISQELFVISVKRHTSKRNIYSFTLINQGTVNEHKTPPLPMTYNLFAVINCKEGAPGSFLIGRVDTQDTAILQQTAEICSIEKINSLTIAPATFQFTSPARNL
jgi:hypothetical protein